MHPAVRFGGLEEADAAVISVPDQPVKLILAKLSLHSSAECAGAEGEPRDFHIGFPERDPIGCRAARRTHRQAAGSGKYARRKARFKKIASGASRHRDSSFWRNAITSRGDDCAGLVLRARRWIG